MQEVGIDMQDVTNPLTMLTMGDYVVVAHDNTENMLAVFNMKTGKTQHLLPRGHGENEVLDVSQMQVRNTTSFYVYDFFSNKILLLRLGEGNTFEIKFKENVDDYLSLAIDSDTLFVGNCMDSDCRYKVYDRRSGKEEHVGSYETFGLDPNVGKILLQGNILNDEVNDRFVWMSFYGTAWQVVSYKDSARVIHTRIFDLPQFQTQGDGQAVFDSKTKIGFTSITSSPQYIYALYSGHSLEEITSKKEEVKMGGNIFVLDWDGEVKGRMHTSENVAQIAYNREKNYLYLLCDDSTGFSLKRVRM